MNKVFITLIILLIVLTRLIPHPPNFTPVIAVGLFGGAYIGNRGTFDNIEAIRNKEKSRWAYMKKNPLGIDALAFKGYDDPKEIMDYINQYVNHSKLFEKALKKKIDI